MKLSSYFGLHIKHLSILCIVLLFGTLLGCRPSLLKMVANGDVSGVEEVLATDPDPVEVDRAIGKASWYGHIDIVQLLLGKTSDDAVNRGLVYASRRGHVDIVELLLNNGADIEYFGMRPHLGYTPLHEAAARGQTEVIQKLVERGAILLAQANAFTQNENNIVIEKEKGNTPFTLALIEGNVKTATLICTLGGYKPGQEIIWKNVAVEAGNTGMYYAAEDLVENAAKGWAVTIRGGNVLPAKSGDAREIARELGIDWPLCETSERKE